MEWNLDPRIAAPLALIAWRYMDEVWRLWGRLGTGHGISGERVTAFWLAMVALLAALISPLDPLSETLFLAHMAQHLLLILVAPPLLAYALPVADWIRLLPPRWRRNLAQWGHRRKLAGQIWESLTHPLMLAGLYAAVLWGWHLPAFYEAAIENPTIHLLEHATFMMVAYLFWWRILDGQKLHTTIGIKIIVLFLTAFHSSILGLLLTFSTEVWYPAYAIGAWGFTALEDQQLAGLLMWLPGGILYLIMGLYLFAQWFRNMDERYRILAQGQHENRNRHIG